MQVAYGRCREVDVHEGIAVACAVAPYVNASPSKKHTHSTP